jgi:hypothetical protein
LPLIIIFPILAELVYGVSGGVLSGPPNGDVAIRSPDDGLASRTDARSRRPFMKQVDRTRWQLFDAARQNWLGTTENCLFHSSTILVVLPYN